MLKAVEKSFITKAYRQAGENQSRAAEMLGLGRDKLRYRMKQLETEPAAEEHPS